MTQTSRAIGRMAGVATLAAAGGLFLADSAGQVTPVAPAAGGYRAGAPLSEAYLAVSPGLHDAGSGCDFTKDDVFVLQLAGPVGVVRVSADGHAALFATVSNADLLSGIVFDQTGRFGHQLLITGPRHSRSVVDAIDCRGHVTLVTDAAPTLEGGLAVAPAGFGAYAGDLVAPDELSGRLLDQRRWDLSRYRRVGPAAWGRHRRGRGWVRTAGLFRRRVDLLRRSRNPG